MTFNIHHGVGTDRRLDLSRTANVIRAAVADVVGLQEVDRHFGARSDFVDQATWLAEDLGMDVVFGANLDLDPLVAGQPRRQYGTAILSAHPILDWENTHLPRFDDHEPRNRVEPNDPVESIEGDDDAVFGGNSAPGKAGSAAARHERHTRVMTQAHDVDDLALRFRDDHRARSRAKRRQAVRFVGGERTGLRQDARTELAL